MPTLLIADDHASVLAALEYVLAGEDLRVVLANGGSEALARLGSQPVDAALIDLHMPAMDGLTLTRAIKAEAAKVGRTLPVWVMTAAHTAAAAEQARLAGAEELLKKPFDTAAFRSDLLQFLVGSTARTFAA
jgi:two-component system response regulator MprA